MTNLFNPEADPHDTLMLSFASLVTCYMELLKDPEQIDQSREAGKTLRYFARCLFDTPFEFGELQDLDDDEEI
ncbi:MAG: hypothetical protein ACR2HF_06185 [Methylococcaceae bacterium]